MNGREISRLTLRNWRRMVVADGWDGLGRGDAALLGWANGRLGRLGGLYTALCARCLIPAPQVGGDGDLTMAIRPRGEGARPRFVSPR